MNRAGRRLKSPFVLATASAALIACGSSLATGPKELVDARAAYSRAAGGPAATYDPTDLQVAKRSLDRAEKWAKESTTAPETRTQAYLALRRAEIAEARGEADLAVAQSRQAQQSLIQQQAQSLAAVKAELERARGELAEAQRSQSSAEQRAMAVLERQGQVRQGPEGKIVTLPGEVLFQVGKSDLLPSSKGKLDAVAQALKDMPDKRAVIEGFTDSTGGDAINQPLSDARAQAVKDYLTSRGVPDADVAAKGMSSRDPVASNATAEGRAQNRRVEIVVRQGAAEMQKAPPK